jgi:hypothetical protein
MRREAGRVVAQPAQVDDLGDSGALGLAGNDLRRLPVALLEVGRVQRVHQVVNEPDPACDAEPTTGMATASLDGQSAVETTRCSRQLRRMAAFVVA